MLEQDLFDAHPIIGESEEKIELDVVLSVFDGMSCGQLALKQAGMTPRVYYASEIEKSPMLITKKNFPSTIMLGDVQKVKGEDLPHVNLLLGGSPCQGFSFAGKQLNFDDPRSKLFFEFVRLLNECKPDFFLLENVVMAQDFQDIISAHVSGKLEPGEKGIQPQLINSADCSAQNRKRLYWWGKRVGDKYIQLPIPDIEDMGIVLKDILEDIPVDKEVIPYMTGTYGGTSRLDKGIFNFTDEDKSKCITTKTGHANKYLIHRPCEIRKDWKPRFTENYLQWDINDTGYDSQDQRAYYEEGKHGTLMSDGGGNKAKVTKISPESAKKYAPSGGKFVDPFNKKEIKGDKSTTLRTNSSNGNMWVRMDEETKCHHIATALDVEGHDMNKRVYAETGKSPTLHTRAGETKVLTDVVVLNENQKNKIDKINPTLDKANCLTTAIGRGGSSSEYLTAVKKKTLALADDHSDQLTYRKLTVTECARLQTVPDSYMEDCFDEKGKPVSDTQKFKALGNGWTVAVIVHILQGMRYIVKD